MQTLHFLCSLLPLSLFLTVSASHSRRDCGPSAWVDYSGPIQGVVPGPSGKPNTIGWLGQGTGVGGNLQLIQDGGSGGARGTWQFQACNVAEGFDLICPVSQQPGSLDTIGH